MSQNLKLKILVVDDEPLVADTLVQILKMAGYDAFSAYSGTQAVERAADGGFDVIISDVVMDKMNGIDSAIAIRKHLPSCKVLLVSGDNRTADLLKDAQARGHVFDVLPKPVHPSLILDMLKA